MTPRQHDSNATTQLLAAYQSMLMMRRIEERAGQLFALGYLEHPFPVSFGWEAALYALAAWADAGDVFITTDMRPGLALALGDDAEAVLRVSACVPAGSSGLYIKRVAGEAVSACAPATWVQQLAAARSVMGSSSRCVLIAALPGEATVNLARRLSQACREMPRTTLVLAGDESARGCEAGRAACDDLGQLFAGVGRVWRTLPASDPSQIAQTLIEAADTAVGFGGATPVLDLVTATFQGHAQTRHRRGPVRDAIADPLIATRDQILASGEVHDGAVLLIETGARARIAAAVDRFRAETTP